MKKNIVICSDYAFIEGGATQVAINNAISLSNRGYNVYFVSGMGLPCETLNNGKIKLVPLNVFDLLSNPSKLDAFVKGIYNKNVERRIYEFLLKLEPSETIVHIHTYTKALTSACFCAASRAGIPICVTIHDYFLACPNGGFYHYKKRKICEYYPLSWRCVTCNCDSRNYYFKLWRLLRQLHQNHIIRSSNNVHLIYLSNYSRKKLESTLKFSKKSYQLRNAIHFDGRVRIKAENNKKYYFIGRVVAEKGIDLFCEAINKAEVSAVVIGEGDSRDFFQRQYSNIEFTGWKSKEQIRELLNSARCLIFPSPILEVSPLTVPVPYKPLYLLWFILIFQRSATQSMTIKPILWRVRSYCDPGFPRPTINFMRRFFISI